MNWRALVAPLAALALGGCEDSVTGFLSCGIEACSARERCVETASGPTCVCAEGFEGPGCNTCSSGYRRVSDNVCELIPIDCATDPTVCGLHGTCVDSPDGDSCRCDELYEGHLCERCASGYQDNDSDGVCRPTCATAALDCKAPSRCSDERGTAVCECPTGYTGDDCARCALGYRDTGSACVPTCAASELRCAPNQVCVDEPTGARCVCPKGYAGTGCTSCAQGYRQDPSTGVCLPSCDGASIACGEHGVCDDSVGFARCVCELGYTGDSCQICAEHFEADAGGECRRALDDTETLVVTASHQSRKILATIDPTSGAVRPLVEHTTSGIAQGNEPRTLFSNQAGTITRLSLPSSTAQELVKGSGAVGPLAYDPGLGRVYALGGQAPYRLLSIEPASKVVVELFDTGLAGVADLAFDAAQNRLLALRDTLYAVDLGSGAVSELGELPPATVGIEVASDGSILAVSATDADEATSRVQACRATASRLGFAGYSGATGRFVRPASDATSVGIEAAASDALEVVSYLGRGGDVPPRTVELALDNTDAVVCLALEEPTIVSVPAGSRFRAIVVYAADAAVELAVDDAVPVAASPRLFLGGYAPSFTHPARDDILTYTPQEWSALRLPIDPRFHQPGPGVLHTLDATLAVGSSLALSGAAIPSGPLCAWTPLLP